MGFYTSRRAAMRNLQSYVLIALAFSTVFIITIAGVIK